MADGIIIIDKPQDWTSMDVCAKLRGIFHERRIGHAGTLDPMATGVLPVFVGRATRAVEFASESEKGVCSRRCGWGWSTNTQDTTGTVLAERPVSVGPGGAGGRYWGSSGERSGRCPPCTPPSRWEERSSMSWPERARRWSGSPGPSPSTALERWKSRRGPDGLTPCGCGVPRGPMCAPCAMILAGHWGAAGCMSGLRRTMAAGFKLEDAVPLEQVLAGGGTRRPCCWGWTPTLLTALC